MNQRHKNSPRKTTLTILLLVLTISLSGFSSAYQLPGSGTSSDPYEISNLTDFNQTRENLTAHYKLVDDINASPTKNWNNGKGWKPIGNTTTGYDFRGYFKGNSHKITGLYLNREQSGNQGLFGQTNSSEIENLTLKNANISGKGATGGISGRINKNTNISDIVVEGFIKGRNRVGGIVGINKDGNITKSAFNGEVRGNNYVGGVLGVLTSNPNDDPSLTQSYSKGTVYSAGNDAGGLLAKGDGRSMVNNSFSLASVDGNKETGGFISAGGLNLYNSYSIGEVEAKYNLGGFSYASTPGNNRYWDINSSGLTESGSGKGLTTSQLKENNSINGFDYTNTWAVGDKNGGYPYLQDVPVIPYIYDFEVERLPNNNVNVSLKVGQQLSNITVDVKGPEPTTLTEDNFTRSGTLYYINYSTSSQGEYNATLKEAVSASNDLDGADDEFSQTICDQGTLETECKVNSTKKLTDTSQNAGFQHPLEGGNLTIQSNGTIQKEVNADSFKLNFTDIVIEDGGTLRGNVNITADNLTVDEGGVINATGMGYKGGGGANDCCNGYGPGAGEGNGHGGAGGSYGGRGGDNGDEFNEGGSVYGSVLDPSKFGSGGGAWQSKAGNGGGRITVTAQSLTLSGNMLANGLKGASGGNAAGGGSGGSISINANLSGKGIIKASGGDSGANGGGGGAAGAGGGGRIAIDGDSDAYSGSLNVRGGVDGDPELNGNSGNPGTIYPRNTICDTGNLSTECTLTEIHENSIPSFNGTNLTVTSGTALKGGQNLTLNFSHITIEKDANITATKHMEVNAESMNVSGKIDVTARPDPDYSDTNRYLDLNVSDLDVSSGIRANVNISSDNFTLAESGWLNASGLGYTGGKGQGNDGKGPGGGIGGPNCCDSGSGAGHGALGGYSAPEEDGSQEGGGIYGDLVRPLSYGSGGGGGKCASQRCGGDGGGRIVVDSDKAILNGEISTQGVKGYDENRESGGGGSGGSIFVNLTSLNGEGVIKAKGGKGGGNNHAGGGAGGRVAIHTDSDPREYSLSVNVSGGEGYEDGGDGTVYTPLDVSLDKSTVKDGEELEITGRPAVDIYGALKDHGIQVWQNGKLTEHRHWSGPAPDLDLTEGIDANSNRGLNPEVTELNGSKVLLIVGDRRNKWAYNWTGNKWQRNDEFLNNLPTPGKANNVEVSDFDHDGEKEMIYGHRSFVSGYRWTGTKWVNDTSLKAGIEGLEGVEFRPMIKDLNENGEFDLIFSANSGPFQGFTWNGTGWENNTSVVEGLETLDTSSNHRSDIGDIDSDGKYELIQGNSLNGREWNGSAWKKEILNKSITGLTNQKKRGMRPDITEFKDDNSVELIGGFWGRTIYGWSWSQLSTDSRGTFNYNFEPNKAGNQSLTFNSSNGTKLAGEGTISFIKDELTLENNQSKFVSETDSYIDVDETSGSTEVNLSVKVYENVDNPIDSVWANITAPDGSEKKFSLSTSGSASETSLWNSKINTGTEFSNQLGRYNVTYHAKSSLSNGKIREGRDYNSSFYIQNVSMPFDKDQKTLDPGETLELNGTVYSRPSDFLISDTGIDVAINGNIQQNKWNRVERLERNITSISGQGGNEERVELGDFDKDGLVELAAFEYDYVFQEWNGSRWTGDSSARNGLESNQPNSIKGQDRKGELIADIDNDNNFEAIVDGLNNGLAGFRWNGSAWKREDNFVAGLKGGKGSRTVADIDGDGKKDVIRGNRRNYQYAYSWEGYWDRNNSLDSGTSSYLYKFPDTKPELADLDRDNKQELLEGTSDGKIRGYKWDGTQWVANFEINESLPDFGRTAVPSLADFNQDGRTEVIVSRDNGERYVYQYTHPISQNSGKWSYNLTVPERAGTYDLKINTTDQNGIYGENSTKFNVTLPISKQEAEFSVSNNSHVDVDGSNQKVNLTAYVGNSSDADVDKAWVKVKSPQGTTKTYFMDNTTFKNTSQTWNRTLDVASEFTNNGHTTLGQYNISFHANTTRGIGSETKNTSFYVENVSIEDNLDDSKVNLGDEVTVSGKAELEPSKDRIETNPVNLEISNSTWNRSIQQSETLEWKTSQDWNDSAVNRVEHASFGLGGNSSVELGINLKKQMGEDLMLWYTMDEADLSDTDGDGNYEEIIDRSGNGHNGSLNGDMDFPELTANNGTALTFDGSDDIIKYTIDKTKFPEEITTGGYYNKENKNENKVSIFSTRGFNNEISRYRVQFFGDLQVQWYEDNNGNTLRGGVSKDGATRSIVFRYNGTHGELLSEFEKVDSLKGSWNGAEANPGNIGGSSKNNADFRGSINSWFIYNKSLRDKQLNKIEYARYNGSLTTAYKTTSEKTTELYLGDLNYSLNNGSIEVTVQSDYDGDGTVEENASTVELDGDSSYQVRGLSEPSDKYRLHIELESDNVTKSPVLHDVEVVAGEGTNPENVEVGQSNFDRRPDLNISVDEGLFARYSLNGSANATVGSDGTENGGLSYVQGFDTIQAADFDGNNDYINVSDGKVADFGSKNVTVSAWFKTTENPNNNKPILAKSENFDNGIRLTSNPDGKIIFNVEEESGSQCTASSTGYQDGQFHHAVGTYDRTKNKLYLYIDGEQVSQSSCNIGDISYNGDLGIGAFGNGNRNFNGTIDEVRLYNRSLSSNEVSKLYNLGSETRSSLNSYAVDTDIIFGIGGNNPSIQNSRPSLGSGTASVEVFSDPDNDESFEETSDPVSLNGSGGPYTVSGLSSDSHRFKFRVNLSGDAEVKSFRFAPGSDQSGEYRRSFEAPTEPGNYTVKVNTTDRNGVYGENETTLSVYNMTTKISDYPENVFKDQSDVPGYNFTDTLISDSENPGDINDIRYKYWLPDSWQTSLPISGSCDSYSETSPQTTFSNLQPGGTSSFSPCVDIGPNAELGPQTIVLNASSRDNITAEYDSNAPVRLEGEDLTAWYQFNGKEDEVVDSANDFDGTNKESKRGVKGKFGNAFDFSEANDGVNIPDQDKLFHNGSKAWINFSWSIWVNAENLNSNSKIFNKGGTDDGEDITSLAPNGNGELQWIILDDSTSPNYKVVTNTSVSKNEWVHLSGVKKWNGTHSILQLYKNGELADRTVDEHKLTGPDTNSPLRIGYSSYNNVGFDGKLDSFRIYNSTLSKDQVEKLFWRNKITVWTTSTLSIKNTDVKDPIPRSQEYWQVYADVYDSVNDSKLEGINTTFQLYKQNDEGNYKVVDGATKTVKSNSSGIAKYNWSTQNYGVGKYYVSAATEDMPDRYINFTAPEVGSTNFFNVSGVFGLENDYISDKTVYRENGSSTDSISTLSVKLNNSLGNNPANATVTWQMPDGNLTAETNDNGYAYINNYNPKDTVEPGNYTINITAEKDNYQTYSFNRTIEIRGKLNITNDFTQEVLTRGMKTDFNSTVDDENGEKINDANVNWTINGTTVATGEDTYEAATNISLGNHTLKAKAERKYYDSDSDSVETTVYGQAGITDLYPHNSTILPGTEINVTATVKDSNTSANVSGLDVEFYVEGSKVSTNTTSAAGTASFNWTPAEGNHTLKAKINDNSSILYNVSDDEKYSEIEIDKELYIEEVNRSEKTVYRVEGSLYDPEVSNIAVKLTETSRTDQPKAAVNRTIYMDLNETDMYQCETDSNGECTVSLDPEDSEPGNDTLELYTNNGTYEDDLYTTWLKIKGSFTGNPASAHDIKEGQINTPLVRGESRTATFELKNTKGDEVDVPVDWTFAGRNINSNESTVTFNIGVDEALGTQSLKAEANTPYYYSGGGANSDTVNLQVYGKANANLERPSNSTKVGYGETPELLCSVNDQTGDDISDYPVEFFQNSTSLANKTTDFNGEAVKEWDVPNKVTEYKVGCRIQDNNSLNYQATTKESSKLYETTDDVAPDVGNLSVNPTELKPGEKVDINFTASDQVAIDDTYVEITDPFFETTRIEVTNNSGVFETTYTTDSSAKGTYTVEAKAEDTNGNVGSASDTFKTSKAAKINIDPRSYDADKVRINQKESYNTSATLTADASLTDVNLSVNISDEYKDKFDYNSTERQCGDLADSEKCTKNFTVSVKSGVPPQTLFVDFVGEWINQSSGNTSSVKKVQTVQVGENPVMNASPSSQFKDRLVAANKSYNMSIDVENLGNYEVREFRTSFNSSGIKQDNLDFYKGSTREIPASSSQSKRTHTVKPELFVPYGFSPGNYTANISFTGKQSSENATAKYHVDEYRELNVTPKNKDVTLVVGQQQYIGSINITSLSNVDIDVTGTQTAQTDTEVSNNLNVSFPASQGIKPLKTHQFDIWTDSDGINNLGDYRLQYEFDTSVGSASSKLSTYDIKVVNLSANIHSSKQQEDVDITSDSQDSIKFSVSEGANKRTKDLNFTVKLVNNTESLSSETAILDQSNSSGNFTLDYSFPDLPDAREYDLVLVVKDSDLGVTLEKKIADKYNYKDVSKPEYEKVDVTDVYKEETVDVEINVSDNNLDTVRNVSYEVEFPDTTKNFHLNRSNGLWKGSFTPPSETGDYKGTLKATDASYNNKTFEEYFRVGEKKNFSGRFEDSGGNLLSADIELKDPDTGERIKNLNISKSGKYSFDTFSGKYDVEVKTQGNKITLKDAEISSDDPLKIDELTGSEAPSPKTKGKVMGIAVKQKMNPSSGEITFNYSEFEDNIPSDESIADVEVGRCKDINYSQVSCEGGWKKLNRTSYTTDVNAKTVTASVPGFSIYALYFPEETNEQLEEIQEDVQQTQSSLGGLSGNLSNLQQQLNENQSSGSGSGDTSGLNLGSNSISASIKPGETKSVSLLLQNGNENEQEYEFSISDALARFVTLPEDQEIEPGQSSEVIIEISAPAGETPSSYSGTLNIEGDDSARQVPTNIQILPPDSELLDLSIEPVFDTVEPGDTAQVEATFNNQGYSRNVDVTLNLEMVNPDTNETIASRETTLAVSTTLTRVIDMQIPEDAPLKNYEVRGTARYSNIEVPQVATSVATVEVNKPFWSRTFLGVNYGTIALGIVAVIITSISAAGIYQYRRKKALAKKRYMEQIDLDTIPSGGQRRAYVGELAEMGTRTFMNLDDLTTHALIAGATGSGKTVTGQVVVEEALKEGVNVIVLDPTAQWSGYLRECNEDEMLQLYSEFGMSKSDARSFNGNIRAVEPDQPEIDITEYLQAEEDEGEIIVFSMHKLDNENLDKFVDSTIQQVFDANLPERNHLETMIVYDEAHRILEKFGGSGKGLDQMERGAREFRKWGVGMILLSQVVADFPGEVRANIGTTMQMRTQYEGDLGRLKDKFGMDTVQSVAKAEVGSGMVQNSDYNHGRPYFVNFRPMLHSPHRLSDEQLDKYESYNRKIDQLEARIDELEEQGQEVYEYRSQLKLAKKNLRKGSFNLVDIYTDELQDDLL